MSRKVEFINERVLNSLKRKDKLEERALEIIAEAETHQNRLEELKTEHNTLVSKAQREDEKVKNNLELQEFVKNLEDSIGEFEDISRLYLGKEGDEKDKIYFEIADRLEEWKIIFKQQKEKQKNERNNRSNSSEGGDNTSSDVELPTEKPENDNNIG